GGAGGGGPLPPGPGGRANATSRGSGAPATAGYLGPAYGPFEVEGDPGRGTLRIDGVALPDGFTAADLADRARLRARFDARFKALDQGDVAASLDRFHQAAPDILRSDLTP